MTDDAVNETSERLRPGSPTRPPLQVVGGGKMGEALLGGIIASGLVSERDASIVELNDERRVHLQGQFPSATITAEISSPAPAIIAVKPQYVTDVAADLGLAGVTRALSVAAGVRLAAIESAMPGAAVVRCMPNTPALVGEGAAAIAPGEHADAADMDWAASMLDAVGVVVRVDEGDLDAVTGVSGSGPAYVFRLAEALIAAGVAEGLDPDVADVLARQTILGAGRLLVDSGEDPGVLRENVTSPGGTTAAGLAVFESADFGDLVRRVVGAAASRSVELGG